MAFKLSLITPIRHLQANKTPNFYTQFLLTNPIFRSSCSKLNSRRKSSVCSNSLKQETIQNPAPTSASSNKLVLVIGGTGGVGQLVVASLLNRDVKLHLLLRNPEKATALFGEQEEEKLQVIKGDTRNSEDLDPSMFEGVTHVICCTGTTAFPSR
ncbi:protein TIC 62, chloroplastic-like [Bidens hawaiensis]|uniref:protein TIC 62, chloroplastic-like n=1 Tax=Bidens hawaiensis TaxID=980011 RepID=UPI00404A3D9B